MSKSKSDVHTRRAFLTTIPAVIVGSSFLEDISVQPSLSICQELKAQLSDDEAALVKKSKMAQELKDYFGKEYSCAESLLMVSLRFSQVTDEHVWAAAGFGGGMGHGDLCGFLTGGYMGIGFAGGALEGTRKEAKARCNPAFKAFWTWWPTQAPARCADILKAGYGYSGCMRLGQLAAAKLEELIKNL